MQSPPPDAAAPPPGIVERLWHIPFNQLEKTNEQLVTGREDIYFGAEFSASAGTNKLPDAAASYYVDRLASNPSALHGSFQMYRAFTTSAAQNEQRKAKPLTMPVLALAGTESSGDMVANTMKLVAEDVQSVLFDAGHWIAEQAPEQMLEALGPFLAPYRDASTRATAGAGS